MSGKKDSTIKPATTPVAKRIGKKATLDLKETSSENTVPKESVGKDKLGVFKSVTTEPIVDSVMQDTFIEFKEKCETLKRKRDDLKKECSDIQTSEYEQLLKLQGKTVMKSIELLNFYRDVLLDNEKKMVIISKSGSECMLEQAKKIKKAIELLESAKRPTLMEWNYGLSLDSPSTPPAKPAYTSFHNDDCSSVDSSESDYVSDD